MSDLALAGTVHAPISRVAGERTPVQRTLSAEVRSGVEAYLALAPEWLRLAKLQGGTSPFQAPHLLAVWGRHFVKGRNGVPATIVVRHDARPVLIWPLFVERRTLVSIASGAGAPIGQYDEILLDPDYDGPTVLAVAIDALLKSLHPDLLFLENVRADGALRSALGDTEPLSWSEAAPYADLSQGMAAVMKSLKARVARQQRKRMRRFAEEGRVDFQVAQEPSEAKAWLSEAMALKREWLRSTGRVSRAFMKRETAECLSGLAQALTEPGVSPQVIVSRLALDGRTAAIEMGFRNGASYHLYLGAFVPEFAKLGPGNVLTEKVLEWCAENGIERYDMMAPRSRNKSEWQSGEVAVLDFALPMTPRGRLYTAGVLKGLAPALRQGFYALPTPLRSGLAGLALGRSGKNSREPGPDFSGDA
jgi:CelD/BcsL family acetyltransferase involved in cellulose biosynthesis